MIWWTNSGEWCRWFRRVCVGCGWPVCQQMILFYVVVTAAAFITCERHWNKSKYSYYYLYHADPGMVQLFLYITFCCRITNSVLALMHSAHAHSTKHIASHAHTQKLTNISITYRIIHLIFLSLSFPSASVTRLWRMKDKKIKEKTK